MSEMHQPATLTGGQVPAHVPGAYPNLSCCGGEIRLVPVEPLCDCGHPISMHQTGEGPWTGFCYAEIGPENDARVPREDCECESPTLDGLPYLHPTYNADGICPHCGVAATDRERLLGHDEIEEDF